MKKPATTQAQAPPVRCSEWQWKRRGGRWMGVNCAMKKNVEYGIAKKMKEWEVNERRNGGHLL
jgi:hypothetical protein